MKILEYEFYGSNWKFHNIYFQKVNLVVGDSGTGKTRLLNTIFNLGSCVAQRKLGGISEWKVSLNVNEDIFRWNVSTIKQDNQVVVEKEHLFLNDKLILERDDGEFHFDGGKLPKLPSNEMSLSILREEELIKPLYNGFSKILRRKFFEDALSRNSDFYAINQQVIENVGEKSDLFELFKMEFPLNPKLFVLSNYFPGIYERIIDNFLEAFDFITDVAIFDSSDFDDLSLPGRTPVFCIRERNVGNWLRLNELSSGMQKVLLILTDLFSFPEGGIYLIDEYENSLGVGPIDFLPNLILLNEFDTQIFVTSHHPYIIDKIPIENWYVAHRVGSEVQFAFGDELVKRYGVSTQEKYIQLLNDPFYSEGIE